MAEARELLVAALPAYEVQEELGQGGFGVVLAGRHRRLGREVAIKQLRSDLTADAFKRRFMSEARLLAGLDHPHVVPVYDFIEYDNLLLLVMERLRGGTLRERGRSAAVSHQEACAILLATCSALHYAHGKGVLHRDVKPENLMFSSQGTLKVGDFGIAKLISDSRGPTTRGTVVGTPAYMAPEQAQSLELTAAADVYAAGTVLYEVLSGRLPYPEATDPLAALYQHVHEDPAPLATIAPEVPVGLAATVARALQRDPKQRYLSAEAFGVAIAEAGNVAWGTGWLQSTGTPVLLGGNIAIAVAHQDVSSSDARTENVPALPVSAASVSARWRARPRIDVDEARPPAGDLATAGGRGLPRYWIVIAMVVAMLAGGVAILSVLRGGSTDAPAGSLNSGSMRITTTVVEGSRDAGGTVRSNSPSPSPTVADDRDVVLGRDLMPISNESCRDPTTGTGGAWQDRSVTIGGTQYEPSYSCNLFPGAAGSLDFALGRSYTELRLVIGFSDESAASPSAVRFEIIGDGTDYLTQPAVLKFGESRALVVNVRGVTRLRIRLSATTGGAAESPLIPVLGRPSLV